MTLHPPRRRVRLRRPRRLRTRCTRRLHRRRHRVRHRRRQRRGDPRRRPRLPGRRDRRHRQGHRRDDLPVTSAEPDDGAAAALRDPRRRRPRNVAAERHRVRRAGVAPVRHCQALPRVLALQREDLAVRSRCRRRNSNPRHADYDSASSLASWLCSVLSVLLSCAQLRRSCRVRCTSGCTRRAPRSLGAQRQRRRHSGGRRRRAPGCGGRSAWSSLCRRGRCSRPSPRRAGRRGRPSCSRSGAGRGCARA